MASSLRMVLVTALTVQLFVAPAFSQVAATVKEVAIERARGETFFRVTVNWPAQGVPEYYAEFLPPEKDSYELFWPVEALALIPQDGDAFLVVREIDTFEQRQLPDRDMLEQLPQTVTFLGKLKRIGKVEFKLRTPAPGSKYQTLPLGVDFTKAAPEKDLKRRWATAQANFFRLFKASVDSSFPAFAYEQLLRRLGREAQFFSPWNSRGPGRPGLYEITTGAMALQESLQLDRLRNPGPHPGPPTVPLNSISGVAIKAHPWDKMLAGKSPKVEAIAALVPEDQYYLRFRTLKAMRAFLDFADQWGGLMLSQLDVGGRDYGSREKLERQLCLRASWLSDLLGEAVVESVVLTGTDPYLREGTDLSLIFHLKSEGLFFASVNRYLDEARRGRADLKEGRSKYREVEIESYQTSDSEVRTFRARLGEYAVYSNSPAAIRRIIDAFQGRRPSLAGAKDFLFLRSLYPLDHPDEDGFLFLSDPFLRYLTGPKLRIAEKRRIEALTTLELVKNAALFYLWENPGAPFPELKVLTSVGLLRKVELMLEPGDQLNWHPETFTASSARYGRMGYLTPIVEIDLDKVTVQESQEYEVFRRNYEDYWRRYFDPVGIRITARERMALSMTILPLIQSSEYNHTREDIGGRAVELEPAPRGERVLFHAAVHLNPESDDIKKLHTFSFNLLGSDSRASIEWLGERVEFWAEDSPVLGKLLDLPLDSEKGTCTLLSSPLVAAVEVKNPLALTTFLVALRAMVEKSAPNLVNFESSEKYKDHVFTLVRPTRQAEISNACRDVYLAYGAVGKMFYLSTSLPALQRVVDQVTEKKSGPGVDILYGAAKSGHLAVRLNLSASKSLVDLLGKELTRRAMQSEHEHLRNLWLVAQVAGLGEGARLPVEKVLGYSVVSALGSSFRYDRTRDEVVSSTAGSLWEPKKLHQPPPGSPLEKLLGAVRSLRGTLEFTEDGLHTELSINRKP